MLFASIISSYCSSLVSSCFRHHFTRVQFLIAYLEERNCKILIPRLLLLYVVCGAQYLFVACSALLFVLWALPGSEFYELFVLGFSCFFHLFFCFLFLFFYLNFFLLDGSPSIAWESRFK